MDKIKERDGVYLEREYKSFSMGLKELEWLKKRGVSSSVFDVDFGDQHLQSIYEDMLLCWQLILVYTLHFSIYNFVVVRG